jgi:hypothetical protein
MPACAAIRASVFRIPNELFDLRLRLSHFTPLTSNLDDCGTIPGREYAITSDVEGHRVSVCFAMHENDKDAHDCLLYWSLRHPVSRIDPFVRRTGWMRADRLRRVRPDNGSSRRGASGRRGIHTLRLLVHSGSGRRRP